MVVVAGEALIDVVVDADGDVEEAPGGSPLNVAVGLARLDVATTLITQLGHDTHGGLIVSHLDGSDVDLVGVPTSGGRTATAVARLDAQGMARYEFDLGWDLPRQELPSCQALHVGSLGTVLAPGRDSVLDLVEQAVARDVFVSYDANLRESFLDDRDRTRREVESLGARCTLVKLSDEDAELLAPDVDPDDLARRLLTGERTELVLLTRGSRGGTAFFGDQEVSVLPRQIEVVDTVGAGDAFMAATLAQLADLDAFRRGLPTDPAALERLVAGAVEVAAITCERRGANPPRRSELPTAWPG